MENLLQLIHKVAVAVNPELARFYGYILLILLNQLM
jgi:hypothetical protein